MSYDARLTKALKGKGLSSNALAMQLGISSTAVWNWVHGNTKPRPEMLVKVAGVLGVSPEWLRDGDRASDRKVTDGSAPQSTVQNVLADAKSKLATILQVPEHRIRLELNLLA